MQYGLIGKSLVHSFSREVHALLADYEYELCSLGEEELKDFMTRADFTGINVTIPYKAAVIPYLDFIDPLAESVGAVNTIVKRDGKLYGYNTDVFGLMELIQSTGVEIKNKKCVILGTGGTSRAARAALLRLLAGEILTVSRSADKGDITYDELYKFHTDAEVIINTTPVGMYPNNDESPVLLDSFIGLSLVIDAIYNPLRTKLIRKARRRNIRAEGGLYMLVSQAVYASRIFRSLSITAKGAREAYSKILREKENIVLIGMPSCGKSTLAREIATLTGRTLIDTDENIEKDAKMTIPEIFETYGEKYFRDLESKLIASLSQSQGLIISTGGGAVLRSENVENLKKNGVVCFLDRDI